MARKSAGLSGHTAGQCAGSRQAVDDVKRHIQQLLSGQEAENIGGFDQVGRFLFAQQWGRFFARCR